MTIAPLAPGIQQFYGPNGILLANGSVQNYVPRTTFGKPTWADPAQTTLNANPVVLSPTGTAVMYGWGAIRQVVKDSNGDTISDSLTFGGQQTQTTIILAIGDSAVFQVPAGVKSLYIEAVGAGGGGANCIAAASRSGVSGGGGGAGGYASGIYSVTPGQAISYSVGAGGSAGQAGGTTNFGSFVVCSGGVGSIFSTISTSVGGAGGTATGGTIVNYTGGAGTDGSHLPATGITVYQGAGNGGTSAYGAGGTSTNGGSGNNGPVPGSGGAGSMDVNLTNVLFPGGTGADGQIIITYQG